MKDITIGFVGSGGVGAVTAGVILTEAAAHEGLHAMNVQSFGPQIRGGESSSKARLSMNPVFSPGDELDVAVIFNLVEYPKFRQELPLKETCVILYDPHDSLSANFPFNIGPSMLLVPVPFQQLAREEAGNSLVANIVALGVLGAAFHLPTEGVRNSLKRRFTRKGKDVLESNMKALAAGEHFAGQMEAHIKGNRQFEYQPSKPRLVMTGNDAAALGALWAGCNFYAGYPITPSSEIMHFLSKQLPRRGGVLVQTEDEISAVTHCIGASFAGAKAMTATSGPGVSLMLEGIGLASMSEVPLVIVNVQRGGPSTGLPTKTEQGDLMQAIYGTHGDAPKAVFAPADVQDCFDVCVEAFYAADRYQLPVLVLSDQLLGQRLETISREELLSGFNKVDGRILPTQEDLKDFKRYRDTESGISPMSIPGMDGGAYLASGIEHGEDGWPSSVFKVHERMVEKRFRKLDSLSRELHFVRTYGPEDAEIGAVCWGSNKGPVREACEQFNADGHKIRLIVPQVLYPLNRQVIESLVRPLRKFVVFESSWNAQLFTHLKGTCSIPPEQAVSYAVAGGRGLNAREVKQAIEEHLS